MSKFRKKVSAMIICFDESLWIGHCIRGIYDHVDEIVVVEGACEKIISLGGEFDGKTKVLIDRIKDTEGKIKFFEAMTFEDKIQQRQFALSQCNGDWVFIVDADEFYKENELKILRATVDDCSPECRMIIYPHHNFFDFGNVESKIYVERLFRNDKDMIGYWGNPIDGQNIYHKGIGKIWGNIDFKSGNQRDFLFIDNVACYHYSKMKSRRYVYMRDKYYIWRENHNITMEELDSAVEELIRQKIFTPDRSKWTSVDCDDHPSIVKMHWLFSRYKELIPQKQESRFIEFLINSLEK